MNRPIIGVHQGILALLCVQVIVFIIGLSQIPGMPARATNQFTPPATSHMPFYGEGWAGFRGSAPEHTGENTVYGNPTLQQQRNIHLKHNTLLREAWRSTLSITGGSSPVVDYGKVYVTYRKVLYALNSNDGSIAWQQTIPYSYLSPYRFGTLSLSVPVVANGMVYVGCSDGNMYAFNAKYGSLVWKEAAIPKGKNYRRSEDISSSPPVVSEKYGYVYIGSRSGELYAFGVYTGSIAWNARAGDLTAKIVSSPAIDTSNGVIYVGSTDGKLYAFYAVNGNPTVAWTPPQTGGGIVSSPAIDISNGVIHVGSDDGNLYEFDRRTGREVWRESTGGSITSSPALAGNTVYAHIWQQRSRQAILAAFDTSTRNTRWLGNTHSYVTSSPAVANGVVYVETGQDLYAFDTRGVPTQAPQNPSEPNLPHGYRMGKGVATSSPAVDNEGRVYVTSHGGDVIAYDRVPC